MYHEEAIAIEGVINSWVVQKKIQDLLETKDNLNSKIYISGQVLWNTIKSKIVYSNQP